jgi:chitinase
VATANAGSNTVSVLISDGEWTPTPPPPMPSVSVGDVTVSEGNSASQAASFVVTLSAASSQPVTVAYTTVNGTAGAGSDYRATTDTMTIPAGQTTGTITVLVNGDRFAEANETFFVNLSSPVGATIADGQGVGTIVDDEPRINITDVSKTEGKKGKTTLFTFVVTLSAAYDQPVTLSYQTVNGTATTGNKDYVAKSGTITFAPGETVKYITIEVKGDRNKEANETFYVDLFGLSSNALFTKNRGLGTIVNDD